MYRTLEHRAGAPLPAESVVLTGIRADCLITAYGWLGSLRNKPGEITGATQAASGEG